MESELERKLERIKKFVNVEKVIRKGKNDPRAIRLYYRVNSAAYRKFHSDRGFMHFRVSMSGEIQEKDVYYQPDVVSGYIKSGAQVVELGPGQGANIFYLTAKHPDASFIGIDLKPPKMPKNAPANLKLVRGNYENLSFIESGSTDVVFGIETVVHCSDKDKVFSEVARILKPGGVFIIYDYATAKSFEEYLPSQQTAIDLMSKGGASARIESDAQWEAHFLNNGFGRITKTDLAEKSLPDLHRLVVKASKIMDHDRRARLVFTFFPRVFTNNILIGYLSEDCTKEGLGYYNEWIYEKK